MNFDQFRRKSIEAENWVNDPNQCLMSNGAKTRHELFHFPKTNKIKPKLIALKNVSSVVLNQKVKQEPWTPSIKNIVVYLNKSLNALPLRHRSLGDSTVQQVKRLFILLTKKISRSIDTITSIYRIV